jgi:hypothetical protein
MPDHPAVLEKEQQAEEPVPSQNLKFWGVPANNAERPEDEESAEKQQGSPADEDSENQHGVCGESVHV